MTLIIRTIKKTTTIVEVAAAPTMRGLDIEWAASYRDHKKQGEISLSVDEPQVVEDWRLMTPIETAMWNQRDT